MNITIQLVQIKCIYEICQKVIEYKKNCNNNKKTQIEFSKQLDCTQSQLDECNRQKKNKQKL